MLAGVFLQVVAPGGTAHSPLISDEPLHMQADKLCLAWGWI